MTLLPEIISVDDHVVEPPTLWTDRLPARYRHVGPRVRRTRGTVGFGKGGKFPLTEKPDDDSLRWGDVWEYEDLVWPLTAGFAAVGPLRDTPSLTFLTYEDILPGCFDQRARLIDMSLNGVEASLCFPTIPRFCGQTFLERRDKELALLCVRVYNDWMIDEWCGGDGRGRLIPLTLIPLWDAQLAAEEVRRCAAKGSHSVAFSENPAALGLPSIHSGYWDPFFQACEETETVINMHIGSSSKLSQTSEDAPIIVALALPSQNSEGALLDWLTCGALARFPTLKIALSEGQVGWMPFTLERIDSLWRRSAGYDPTIFERVPEPPSSYVPGRVYGCIFDDLHGLRSRDTIGMGQIMFETDYPHPDSTFPDSRQVATNLVKEAGLSDTETWQLIRGNAIKCYNLSRYGITE